MQTADTIIIEPLKHALLVRPICGKIDYMTMEKIQRQVGVQAMSNAKHTVIVDLTGIELISSLILGALVKMLKKLQDEGKRMVLVGLSKHNRPTIRLSRLDTLFEVHDSIATAMAAITPPDKD
ncbi:MAG: hypothetical protein HJJLKODD_00356 [Phycisphaerae bacterium]|nr:hypothetical protein [Phycisphaerae bacterium]